jgi:hypothetical protein
MITAQQARENAELCDTNVTKQVQMLCNEIEKQSKEGARKYRPGTGFCHNEFFNIDKYAYRPAEYTKVQRLVKAELEKLGFTLRIVTEQNDGKGGLCQLDDDPKPFTTHEVEISW